MSITSLALAAQLAGSPYLKNLGRPPRIITLGDSIMDSSNLISMIQSAIPGTLVRKDTYAGSVTTAPLFIAATDVQAPITPGNLLLKTDLTTWGLSSTSAVYSTSPTTGRPAYKITTNGVQYQAVQTGGQGGLMPVVPTGAPSLVLSFVFEIGASIQTFSVNIKNTSTGNGIVFNKTFSSVDVINECAGLPARIFIPLFPTDGVGYVAGNTLDIQIILSGPTENWAAGTVYLSEMNMNVGTIPAPWQPTSGTAQTPGTQAWSATPGGIDRKLFDLAVITTGRNDAGAPVPVVEWGKQLASIISGLTQYVPRILVCTPPQQSLSDQSNWDNTDPYINNGYYQEAQRQASRHGVYFYDAVNDFKQLVSSGQYRISDLKRDTLHPTDPGAGIGRYQNAIVNALKSPIDKVPRVYAKPPMARIGGTVASGSWAWTRLSETWGWSYDAQDLFWGHAGDPYIFAMVSSTAGSQLQFSVTGSNLGIIYVGDTSGAAVGSVTIDGASYNINGGTNNQFTATASGPNMMHGTFLVGGLADTTHTVVVTVVSGTLKILGIVAC